MQEVRQLKTTEVQTSLIKGNSTTRDYFMLWYLKGGHDKLQGTRCSTRWEGLVVSESSEVW